MGKLAINGGIPVFNKALKFAHWPQVTEEDLKLVADSVRGGRWCSIFSDSWTEKFAKEWAEYNNVKYCVGVSNGTVSIELALKSLGIKFGDEVIVPAVTFIATASAVTEVGAVPVFADIDVQTGQISASSIEEKITKKTRAVIGVHYGGYPFNVEEVRDVCRRHDLFLIEDAAHAHGTEWNNKKAGTFGEFGSFSFQMSKSLSAGEGGAVITDNVDLFNEAKLIHNIGRVPGAPFYIHFILSSNYRISEFSAAMLVSQLKRLPAQIILKQKNAEYLKKELKSLGLLTLREDPRITRLGYYMLILRYQKNEFGGLSKKKFLEALRAEGVPMEEAYGVPLYKNPCFQRENLRKIFPENVLSLFPDYQKLCLPASEQFCDEQLTLLHHILLSPQESLEGVVKAVKKIKDNLRELLTAD